MKQTSFLVAMLALETSVSGQNFLEKKSTPSASAGEDHGRCRMPEWMQHLQVATIFRDVTPYILENHNFELLDPHEDWEEYCRAFNSIDATEDCGCAGNLDGFCPNNTLNCPGYTLFGDKGAWQAGFGGINNFGVVKVRGDAEVELYGTRNSASWDEASGEGDFWNAWFMDRSALTQPDINFTTYSNDRAAVCWPKDSFVKCSMKPGALLVVGSGGWRNTNGTESGCSYYDAISEIQSPPANFLQYVFDVRTAAKDCFYYELDFSNLSNSMERKGTQFLMNGTYVGGK